MAGDMGEQVKRIFIGLVEQIIIQGPTKKKVLARIDTGATKSSIDATLAKELALGPVVRTRVVKSAHGTSSRPVIHITIKIAGRLIEDEFNLADRSHMTYKVLIGQNVLKHHPFLIDPPKART